MIRKRFKNIKEDDFIFVIYQDVLYIERVRRFDEDNSFYTYYAHYKVDNNEQHKSITISTTNEIVIATNYIDIMRYIIMEKIKINEISMLESKYPDIDSYKRIVPNQFLCKLKKEKDFMVTKFIW